VSGICAGVEWAHRGIDEFTDVWRQGVLCVRVGVSAGGFVCALNRFSRRRHLSVRELLRGWTLSLSASVKPSLLDLRRVVLLGLTAVKAGVPPWTGARALLSDVLDASRLQ